MAQRPLVGFLALAFGVGVSIGFALLANLVLAGYVNAEVFGQVRLLNSLALLALPFVTLGMTTSIIKVCSEDVPDPQKSARFKTCLKLWTPLGMGVALCMAAILLLFDFKMFAAHVQHQWAIVILAIVPVLGLIEMTQSYMHASRKRVQAGVLQGTSKLILVGGGVLGALAYGVWGFVWGTALGALSVVIVLALYLLRRDVVQVQVDFDVAPRVKAYAKPACFASVVAALGLQMDLVLVDWFIDDKTLLGAYGLALMLAGGVLSLLAVYASFILPEMGVMASKLSVFKRGIVKHQTRVLCASIVMGVLVYGISIVLFPVAFDMSYQAGLIYLPWLLLKVAIYGASIILFQALVVQGYVMFRSVVFSVYVLIALGLAFMIMPTYGVEGLIASRIIADMVLLVFAGIGVMRMFKHLNHKIS